jgi:hypothetical protein
MVRIALIAAAGAVACAALPSPGLFAAIGLGIAAIGTGWLGYRRPGEPGFARLAGAAAVTVGAMGCLLGALRVALAIAAIDRVDRLLGSLLG